MRDFLIISGVGASLHGRTLAQVDSQYSGRASKGIGTPVHVELLLQSASTDAGGWHVIFLSRGFVILSCSETDSMGSKSTRSDSLAIARANPRPASVRAILRGAGSTGGIRAVCSSY